MSSNKDILEGSLLYLMAYSASKRMAESDTHFGTDIASLGTVFCMAEER